MEHQEFGKLKTMLSKRNPDRQAECPGMNWSLYVVLNNSEVIINNDGILWHYREDWCQECQRYHSVLRCLEGQGHDLPVAAIIAARNTLHKQMAKDGHDGDNV